MRSSKVLTYPLLVEAYIAYDIYIPIIFVGSPTTGKIGYCARGRSHRSNSVEKERDGVCMYNQGRRARAPLRPYKFLSFSFALVLYLLQAPQRLRSSNVSNTSSSQPASVGRAAQPYRRINLSPFLRWIKLELFLFCVLYTFV